jgi:hypothetical protein
LDLTFNRRILRGGLDCPTLSENEVSTSAGNSGQGSTPEFRARIVGLIIRGRPEDALRLLSKHYSVREPELRVGTVRGHRKALGCYVEREQRIYLSNSDFMNDPFVLLHEFYHHLRASNVGKNRQVDKRADLFAARFIRDFLSLSKPMRERA